MDKYNIITVLNEDYMGFGILFFNSLFDNVDLENINNIYIFDTGLQPKSKEYLNFFPKVNFVETDKKTKFKKMHDKDWQENVYSKTEYLLATIKKDNLPTIMIDSDCIFVYDFMDLIDKNKDFVATRRNRSGFSNHIGSFFVINNVDKAQEFLQDWIEEIKKGNEKHKESPALSRVINTGKYNVGELKEEIISYFGRHTVDDVPDNVRIIHMKSDAGLETIDKRMRQPHVFKYVQRYFR